MGVLCSVSVSLRTRDAAVPSSPVPESPQWGPRFRRELSSLGTRAAHGKVQGRHGGQRERKGRRRGRHGRRRGQLLVQSSWTWPQVHSSALFLSRTSAHLGCRDGSHMWQVRQEGALPSAGPAVWAVPCLHPTPTRAVSWGSCTCRLGWLRALAWRLGLRAERTLLLAMLRVPKLPTSEQGPHVVILCGRVGVGPAGGSTCYSAVCIPCKRPGVSVTAAFFRRLADPLLTDFRELSVSSTARLLVKCTAVSPGRWSFEVREILVTWKLNFPS